MPKHTVLLVEDDLDLLEALSTTLEVEGFDYIAVDNAKEALALIPQQTIDVVVSDINMPGQSGFDLLAEVRQRFPGLPVVLMTAYGQVKQAVSAMQQGAHDYLVKPFGSEQLLESLHRCLGKGPVRGQDQDQPVAVSPASRRTFELARRVAITDSTVMISGESGTGKEVLARYIHRQSARARAPFVALNCAAIPENMLEAILFGHEKGAFTGAHASSPGKFEQANGGTLLLDEISEMELGLQAKLLRVLQEREVERIGGRKSIQLDVRVLATTNRELRLDVEAGRFREDLFYRLSVFPLHWQPLRERVEDIVPMAEHLLACHARKMKMPTLSLDESARQALLAHQWPGNVRELDNAIQRALILQQGTRITAADLCLEGVDPAALMQSVGHLGEVPQAQPVSVAEDADDSHALGQEMRMREFEIILDALRRERGRRNRVAEQLGISPRTLRYKIAKMRECGIDVEEARLSAS